MSISSQIKNVGLASVLKCILVQNDILPAILIQNDEHLSALQRYYPELKQTESFLGIIVSKKNYIEQELTYEKMPEILGYPCGGIMKGESYTLGIIATVKKEEVELVGYTCKDKTTEKLMRSLAKKASICFHTFEEFKHINVKQYNRENVSVRSLIRKIISKIPLDHDDQNEIINTLWNMNGSDEINNEFKKVIQYDNPVHQGMMLGILMQTDNDPLSPFYPLQHHKEHEQVNQILLKLLYGLIAVFKNTRTQHLRTRKHEQKIKTNSNGPS